jgi:basic membrane lipoprotein Med (substrate-binding protein (PBP1-ABC) superfamily)
MSSRIASVRMKRRPLLAAMAVAPVAGVLTRVPAVHAQDPIVVTMVTDTFGLGDQNFNDLAKRGLDRAVEELSVQGEVIESLDAASYVPNLTQAAEQSDLAVGVGFLLTEALTEVANQYPDKSSSTQSPKRRMCRACSSARMRGRSSAAYWPD